MIKNRLGFKSQNETFYSSYIPVNKKSIAAPKGFSSLFVQCVDMLYIQPDRRASTPSIRGSWNHPSHTGTFSVK